MPVPGLRSGRPPRAAGGGATVGRAGRRRGAGSSPRHHPRPEQRQEVRTRRPVPPDVRPRGISSRASGMPRVSATIWSRTRTSSGPASTESSSARASAAGRPATTSSGRPASSLPGTRTPKTMPTRLRPEAAGDERQHLRRGAVDPLLIVDQAQQRQLLCHVRQQARVPPGRSGTGRVPSPNSCPNAVHSASRCGAGRRSSRSSIGAHSWCRPANGQLHLRLNTRRARRSGIPAPARPGTPTAPSCPRQPRPAPPATRLWPLRNAASSPSSVRRSARRPVRAFGTPSSGELTSTEGTGRFTVWLAGGASRRTRRPS